MRYEKEVNESESGQVRHRQKSLKLHIETILTKVELEVGEVE